MWYSSFKIFQLVFRFNFANMSWMIPSQLGKLNMKLRMDMSLVAILTF